jgi:hypothetical protein
MNTKPPVIVELVGPAGAGKSSVSKALSERNTRITQGRLPDVHDARSVPFFAWNLLLLLPSLTKFYRHRTDRFLTMREMAYLAIIRGWLPVLRRQSGIVVLDQGPIYMLSEMLREGPQVLMSQTAQNWWHVTCKMWAGGMDGVIYLDASDATLVERALSREQEHGIKAHDGAWTTRFLAKSRRTLDQVLSSMKMTKPDLKIIYLDTSMTSLDETVNSIISLFKSPLRPSSN